ncbi:hypothetical protein FHX35_001535 [Auritidibacter ignavus]|nr:hypothetical protein [Auritidibacter ignavus]
MVDITLLCEMIGLLAGWHRRPPEEVGEISTEWFERRIIP